MICCIMYYVQGYCIFIPFLIVKSSRQVLNLTLPPSLKISFRMFFIILGKLSLPKCGLFKYKISFGAPKDTNSDKTSLTNSPPLFVFNFPSEKVPAPPSPNWILEFSSKILVLIKSLTDFCLSSTDLPLSIKSTIKPFLNKFKAQNKPQGPAPTTKTLTFEDIFLNSLSILGCSLLEISTE